MRWILPALVGSFFLIVTATPQMARAEESATLKKFFGEYQGIGVVSRKGRGRGSLDRRDLDVSIKPHGEGGFTMTWTTVIAPSYAQERRERTQTVNFIPTTRTEVWRSDPVTTLMSGNAVIWARIGGGNLYVYVATMTEAGGIATSVYKRMLTKSGIRLEFARTQDGRGGFSSTKRSRRASRWRSIGWICRRTWPCTSSTRMGRIRWTPSMSSSPDRSVTALPAAWPSVASGPRPPTRPIPRRRCGTSSLTPIDMRGAKGRA